MNITEIKSCYIGPQVSPEQFISEHFFLSLGKGSISGYDGHTQYAMKPGESCIVIRNHLARYSKTTDGGKFGKVVIIFDQPFLKLFFKKYAPAVEPVRAGAAFLPLAKSSMTDNFLQSLLPYYNTEGKIDERFSDVKREELMLILLKASPELANVFFDFGIPSKIDLAEFMHRNYKFNVSLERFAYLSGRSLSSFKRDFSKIFQLTPNQWLMHKRLDEAFFQIRENGKTSSEIYLDLGFEDISHFSFAFKKRFGSSPTGISRARLIATSQ